MELAALEGAAGDGGVIASAVGMIPRSANRGVPTLADLQATFDESYRVGREVSFAISFGSRGYRSWRSRASSKIIRC